MKKYSRFIIGSLFGVAAFAMAAQPVLAQPGQNDTRRPHYQKPSSPSHAVREKQKGVQENSKKQTGRPDSYGQNKNSYQKRNTSNRHYGYQPKDDKYHQGGYQRNHQTNKSRARPGSGTAHNRGDGNYRPMQNSSGQQYYGPKNNMSPERARALARSGHLQVYKPLSAKVKKQMRPGRPIPRYVEVRHVPPYMVERLPRYHDCEWRIAGRDLLLVAAGTFIIYEIIENVFY